MGHYKKEHYLAAGLCSFLLSFLLLFIGVRLVLGNVVGARNIAAFFCFSLFIGVVASCLTFFRLKLALVFYLAGLAVGFILMYRGFLDRASGWGDLAGIASLMTWIAVGLSAGLIIQALYYLYKRYKR